MSNGNKLPSYSDNHEAREKLLMNQEQTPSKSCLQKLSSCCSYVACCQCYFGKGRSVIKENPMRRFQAWIKVELGKKSKEHKLSVISNLIKLYAHDPEAIVSLKELCRVNPDFTSEFRDDLEFFIPQLCSFFLRGEYGEQEQLYNLIQDGSKTSFFFAHRVYFFFTSSIYQEYSADVCQKSAQIHNGLKEQCETNKEKLFLANSSRLIKWYVELNLTEYYADIVPRSILEKHAGEQPNLLEEIEKNQQHDNILEAERLIDLYAEAVNEAPDREDIITISAKDIVLKPFSVTTEKQISRAEYRQSFVMEQKSALAAFYSTPIFIQTLTEIAKALSQMKTSKEEKHAHLKEQLVKINKRLPASVYVPFVNQSVRNCSVLHVPPNETRIFQTKERTNFMVTVELFRPDEISIYSNRVGEEDEERPLGKESDGVMSRLKKSINKSQQEELDRFKKKFQFLKLDNLRGTIQEQGSKLLKKVHLTKKKTFEEEGSHQDMVRASSDEKLEDLNEIAHIADLRASNALIIGEFNDLERRSLMRASKANRNGNERMETEEIELSEQISKLISRDPSQPKAKVEEKLGLLQKQKFEEIKEEKKRNDDEDSSDSNYLSQSSAKESESEEEEEAKRKTLKDLIKGYQVNRQSDKKKQDDIQNLLAQATDMENGQILRKKIRFSKETCKEQEARVRQASPFGALKSWRLFRFIVKAFDDVRQEQFAMQLLMEIQQVFRLRKLPIWLHTYEILATGARCGIIEMINDSISIDEIHKKTLGGSLQDFYIYNFGKGRRKSNGFKKARDNFLQSLAGYSLACYVLNIKDRHNQNIMIDAAGHIIHIDYGFMLSIAPGKGFNIEQAPFKLTQEFVDVIGGSKSKKFLEFISLMKSGFLALQEHADKILVLVEMMLLGQQDLPCFQADQDTMKELRERLFPRGKKMSEGEAAKFVDQLVQQAYGNWRTVAYDRFQYCCQGIL